LYDAACSIDSIKQWKPELDFLHRVNRI